MKLGDRLQKSKGVVAEACRLFRKRSARGLTLVVVLALIAAVSIVSASPAVRAAVPDRGSKTCIAYCEVNGWLEILGFSKSEHAQAHNPQASASCPLTPSIREAEPPTPHD